MSNLTLRYLGYFGPNRQPADIQFAPGLNVICGASETGKSFIVESIDFMLGQEEPVRDIPERLGYDRIRMALESTGSPPLTVDRSVEGGDFRAFTTLLARESPRVEAKTLRWRHSAARSDTLSFSLLERIGMSSHLLRKNASGQTRSLSFRDLARLCVVTEQEIQTRLSPLLSGQYTTATSEYAAFKLLLTGTDDSALVAVKETSRQREQDVGKIELLDELISDLQGEIDEYGASKDELNEQLVRLEQSIGARNEALANVQERLDSTLGRRGALAREIRNGEARIIEIDELTSRFKLLDQHYETDIGRLAAIVESGSLFLHLEQRRCPLCGAMPSDQHLESDCEGNAAAVVESANAEVIKIQRLRRELGDTVDSLNAERTALLDSLSRFATDYKLVDKELNEIVSPAVSEHRTSYNSLVSKRADVLFLLEKIGRIERLQAQRIELDTEYQQTANGTSASRTQVPKRALDDFAQTIERILQEWHFPNAVRVFFDETKRDIQIDGKDRGSTGKGLRAITHAAVIVGLMEYCRERNLPHPGFVVLDSPLLAYWKPEGDEDDLRGTDLKDMFYRYLMGLDRSCQIIVMENEHPPDSVLANSNVIVFTKNPHHGRYGFFPVSA